jgi:hypothetical protein
MAISPSAKDKYAKRIAMGQPTLVRTLVWPKIAVTFSRESRSLAQASDEPSVNPLALPKQSSEIYDQAPVL